jgi:long-subunit fatty acid transport protein
VLLDGERLNNNMYVQESGAIDEWNLTLGANWAHFLYIGFSVGFQNINYEMLSAYSEESLSGDFGYQLNNVLVTDGGGVNAKFGAIIRPFTNLRFGFALHSPTYYYLTDTYSASMSSYGVGSDEVGTDHYAETDEGNSDYQLITPGRLIYSVAYQFGKKALISMDWDIVDYREAKLKSENGVPYDNINSYTYDDMHTATNFRLGGEYRLSDNISLRAGTAWYQASGKKNLTEDNVEIYAVGTTPQYALDRGTRYLSCGLGYRTGAFFIDAAVIRQNASENFFDFYDSSNHGEDKYATLDTKRTNISLSVGFRF